jgi:thiamine transporter
MKKTFGFTVKDIAEIAILSALAIVLDRVVRIPLGATGGSINISMVPLYVIALRHGWFKSFIAGGIVYGLITCLFDGYGLICYPLEYFVAFGAICILGVASKYINVIKLDNFKNICISYGLLIVSIVLATTIRLFAASIDSVLIWKYNFVEALVYNVTYILPSSIFVCVIMCFLLPVVKKLNNMMPTSFLSK